MDIYKNQFGERLAAALVEAKMRQNVLAEKLGVKDSTVSRWVNGKDFPEDWRLPDICRIINKSIDYFTATQVIVREDPLPKWAENIGQKLESIKEELHNLSQDESELLRLFREGNNFSKRNILDAARQFAPPRTGFKRGPKG